jgi:2,3,4,5-tetrahydropyridine-2-carboxylate N-succinyltransferase
MPSFVNLGAYVGEGTMIDTWATVRQLCADRPQRPHLGRDRGSAACSSRCRRGPVIIEDDCFIGARSEVAEGVVVERGSVISMGVFLGASTKIIDRATGSISYGRVPAYSVVVPGTLPSANGGPSLACAVIVKTVDEKTRSKTASTNCCGTDPCATCSWPCSPWCWPAAPASAIGQCPTSMSCATSTRRPACRTRN